eukprot:TRINITY_DN23533_c0_g1_i3.p1 TRINITY_DN23533_c0_g1~~TRINITY_DN23533_c0_g1_i3.p1  ORF type:complete len:331 (-),score=55.62 TRINITY_DN23533_c0_g1_i3:114-1034(-)
MPPAWMRVARQMPPETRARIVGGQGCFAGANSAASTLVDASLRPSLESLVSHLEDDLLSVAARRQLITVSGEQAIETKGGASPAVTKVSPPPGAAQASGSASADQARTVSSSLTALSPQPPAEPSPLRRRPSKLPIEETTEAARPPLRFLEAKASHIYSESQEQEFVTAGSAARCEVLRQDPTATTGTPTSVNELRALLDARRQLDCAHTDANRLQAVEVTFQMAERAHAEEAMELRACASVVEELEATVWARDAAERASSLWHSHVQDLGARLNRVAVTDRALQQQEASVCAMVAALSTPISLEY